MERRWLRTLRWLQAFGKRYAVALSLLGTFLGTAWGLVLLIDQRISKNFEAAENRTREERRAVEKRLQEQRQEVLEIRKEFQKPFYQRQMDLCLEASDAAAVLATTRDHASSKHAWNTFMRLYWGQLVAVEEKETATPTLVVTRMVEYKKMLARECKHLPCRQEAQACKDICEPEEEQTTALPQCLQCASLNLARACRQLIAEAWQLPK